MILRALCPTESGRDPRARRRRALLEALRHRHPRHPRPAPGRKPGRRRGPAARGRCRGGGRSLLQWRARAGGGGGRSAAQGGARGRRRRAVGGADAGRSWDSLAARPELARGFDHLVALDPPPRGAADPLLHTTPRAYLAWGPAEAEFAVAAYRASLDLRPQLAEVYRALRDLTPEAALHGPRGCRSRNRPLPAHAGDMCTSPHGAHGAGPHGDRARRPQPAESSKA